MKLSTKIFIGFSLILALYVLDFFINSKLFDQVNQNAEFLTRSESIIRNSTRLHKTMINMQSGFRGYLLTDNDNFLESYKEGLSEVPLIVEEQRMFLSDAPRQLAELDTIMQLHSGWIKYSAAIIKSKQDTIVDSAGETAYKLLFENQLKKEVGKSINDNIAREFRQFDAYEYKLRKERRDALNESIRRSRWISLAITLTSLTIGLICAWYLTRLISKRINTMVDLAGQISKGNFRSIEDSAHDELSNLSASLNVMSATLNKNFTELERKNKELDQFAYVVSHDLKAPLRGIDNICSWIVEDMDAELSAELKNYLAMMRGRVHRLEDLINWLLEYARIGRVKRVVQNVNVKDVIDEVVDLLVPQGFQVITKGKMPQIKTEKLRMEQVFANLVGNAVKHHHRSNGVITISVSPQGEYYKFTVEDDGPGIDPEYHEKIFGIFQTLRERDSKESTGVGLAIVKKIIDDQKGTITVRSAEGKGTVFEFMWPREPAGAYELQAIEAKQLT
jgi:signal transduction histidine kinase